MPPPPREKRKASYRRRLAAIEQAQRAGEITTTFTPAQILDLIESLAVGWSGTTRVSVADDRKLKRERAAQRDAITESVRRILTA
jgi:hypothetical protein